MVESTNRRGADYDPERPTAAGRRLDIDPGHTDDTLVHNTGHGWQHWCRLIDEWPGHRDGHAAVASWLQQEHHVDGWWAQSITVGWERITGQRLPHQVADGTFTVSKQATIQIDANLLRAALLDDAQRVRLFAGLEPTLRSRPTSKNVRIGLTDGVAELAISDAGVDKAKVVVQHAQLATFEDVDTWKDYWASWLSDLDSGELHI